MVQLLQTLLKLISHVDLIFLFFRQQHLRAAHHDTVAGLHALRREPALGHGPFQCDFPAKKRVFTSLKKDPRFAVKTRDRSARDFNPALGLTCRLC